MMSFWVFRWKFKFKFKFKKMWHYVKQKLLQVILLRDINFVLGVSPSKGDFPLKTTDMGDNSSF